MSYVLEVNRMKHIDKKKRYRAKEHRSGGFFLNKDGTIREHIDASGSANSNKGNLYICKGVIYWGNGMPLDVPYNRCDVRDGFLPEAISEKEFRELRKLPKNDPERAMPFRYNVIWGAIKMCNSTEEIEILVGHYKNEMRDLDTKNRDHQAYIKEMRTGIIMASAYRKELKHERDTNPDRYVGVPLINMIEGNVEESSQEFTSASNVDTLKTKDGIKKGIERTRGKYEPSIKAYYQIGLDRQVKISKEGIEIVDDHPQKGEFDMYGFKWYHRHYEQRTWENREKLRFRRR
jgi:hypothetical protein